LGVLLAHLVRQLDPAPKVVARLMAARGVDLVALPIARTVVGRSIRTV
jgi:hypothetical protein